MRLIFLSVVAISLSPRLATASTPEFPVLGIIGGSTAYVPVNDHAEKSLVAYDFQSLGGPLDDGKMVPYTLIFREDGAPFERACGPILNCPKLATYAVKSAEAGLSSQQRLVLIFTKPRPLTYMNSSDHIDYVSGRKTWRVRYLSEDENSWEVFIQAFVDGKCETTRKFSVSVDQIDGTVPISKKENFICGKYVGN